MAYFIGNGSVTIGGGSLGRTEQLPSLKLLCVDLCARHLDRLSDLGDIPTEVFIDLLKRAKEKATPELVKRFQDMNERLWCDEVDTAFWKQAVEGHILRRTVPAPGPVMVSRVDDHKERLNALQAVMAPSSGGASTSTSTSSSGVTGKGQEDKQWSRDVSNVLQALEDTSVSVALLRETLIGKSVSPFRKSKDPKIATMAASLVRRWKEAAALAAATTAAAAEAKGGGGGGGGGGSSQLGGGGGGGRAAVGGERRPAEEKQRAVEEGFKCRTWESLFQHLEMLRAEKVRTSSKRAREAREREEQKRPKMIVGKSRGEDFTRKTGRISGKISAPSFFSSRPSSSGPAPLSPQRTPKKKPFTNLSSSSSSSSRRRRSGSSGKGSVNSGAFGPGGGGGSSSSRSKGAGVSVLRGAKKPKKGDHYSSGVTSVAELRRKVVSDQRLSVPVQQLKKPGQSRAGSGGGGGSAGAAAAAATAARSPPHKKSKFWK